MVATVWKGSLSFGLVSLPVRMFSAHQRHGTVMHQFQRGTSDRVRYRRVNERTGDEVPNDEIVKGAKAGDDDEYVMLEPDELRSIAPERTQSMEITAFVPSGSVEPLWYDSAYYLAPDSRAAAKPYRLLCAALDRAGRLGVASLVMREREYLAVIGPQYGVLTLSTLWWNDEIRDPEETMPAIPDVDLGEQELDLAVRLIEAMADEWRPDRFTDVYQERLNELIDAKQSGRRVRYTEHAPPKEGTVVELSDALRASLKGKGSRGTKGGGKGGRRATTGTGGPRGGGGGSSGSRAPAQAEAPVAELSKKELDRLASDLAIPGRSKMNRADLERAIERARAEGSSRSAS